MKQLSVRVGKQVPMEKQTAKCVSQIQKLGVKTFAFTSAHVGHIEGDTSSENFWTLRWKVLSDCGISFENAFPFEFLEVDALRSPDGLCPTYFKGVLLAHTSESKGRVLSEFLKKVPEKPKLIIMIDDTPDNLNSIEESLSKDFPDIQFLGIEYDAIKKLPADDKQSPEKVRDFWQQLAEITKE